MGRNKTQTEKVVLSQDQQVDIRLVNTDKAFELLLRELGDDTGHVIVRVLFGQSPQPRAQQIQGQYTLFWYLKLLADPFQRGLAFVHVWK